MKLRDIQNECTYCPLQTPNYKLKRHTSFAQPLVKPVVTKPINFNSSCFIYSFLRKAALCILGD
jgi:hypothetical protein